MIRNQSGTETAKECLAFIDESVSCFHAVENVTKKLLENGFTELSEKDKWKLKEGESYFIKEMILLSLHSDCRKKKSRDFISWLLIVTLRHLN